ncbi:MAG: IS607 family transposase [Candidatus Hodarchaeales archaeon]|jgi:predicted site-specific integrase-resolvase
MFLSTGKAAILLGVSPSTLRRWDAAKRLVPTFRTPGKHRRYHLTKLLEWSNQVPQRPQNQCARQQPRPRVVAYARVSGSKQRRDLTRQIAHLDNYVQEQGWQHVKTYHDIGSGLNDRRKGLLRLLCDLPSLQPDKIVCTYEDRLARFGIKLLETICTYFSVQIVVTQQSRQPVSLEEQVVQDVVALVTSFAGKLHRARRGQLVVKTA